MYGLILDLALKVQAKTEYYIVTTCYGRTLSVKVYESDKYDARMLHCWRHDYDDIAAELVRLMGE